MKLLFLLYVPRSGSTLFAKLFAERYSNIMVLPETRMPRLLASSAADSAVLSGEVLMELVRQDHQFGSLGLSPDEVAKCAGEMDGAGAGPFLLSVAARIAEKRNVTPDAVLYKCGSAGLWWPALRSLMPGAIFIHVLRDVRAVVNSAIHTERPYHPGQKMGRGDPWHRADDWRKFSRGMRGLCAEGEPVIEVRYEDLCSYTDRELDRVAGRLGISRSRAVSNAFAVAAKERGIHSNVDKPPLAERVEAWQHELKAWQGIATEFVAGDELKVRGYEPWFLARSGRMGKIAGVLHGLAAHLLLSGAHYLRRIAGYLASPSKVPTRLQRYFTSRNLRSRW